MQGSMTSGRRVVADWKNITNMLSSNLPMLTCDPVASAEGISLITLVADTNRHVVPDPAVGIDATQSRARILAFSGDASQLLGAV